MYYIHHWRYMYYQDNMHRWVHMCTIHAYACTCAQYNYFTCIYSVHLIDMCYTGT